MTKEFDLNHAIIIVILNGEIVGVLTKTALFVCMQLQIVAGKKKWYSKIKSKSQF